MLENNHCSRLPAFSTTPISPSSCGTSLGKVGHGGRRWEVHLPPILPPADMPTFDAVQPRFNGPSQVGEPSQHLHLMMRLVVHDSGEIKHSRVGVFKGKKQCRCNQKNLEDAIKGRGGINGQGQASLICGQEKKKLYNFFQISSILFCLQNIGFANVS